jgi:hypothetical protein
MTLENLTKYYNRTLQEAVKLAKKGKRPFTAFHDHMGMDHRESDDKGEKGARNARKQVLTAKLYDALISTDPQILQQIMQKVRDPVLDASLIWLASHSGLEDTSSEEFIKGFTPNLYRSAFAYLRPLILLELITQTPEILEKLEESSSYFPHRPFTQKAIRQTKRELKESLEREIAESLLEMGNEELFEALSEIEKFVYPATRAFLDERTLGKYSILKNMNYAFVDAASEEALDDLVIPRKKDILHNISEAFFILYKRIARKLGKEQLKSGRFKVTNGEFGVTLQTLENYAINQALGIWRSSDGRVRKPETYFTRRMHIKAEGSGDNLIVEGYHGKLTLSPESRFMNTTRYLPIVACIINRIYQNALEYKQEKHD